ncbi:WD40-repeat-containing domain protein [Dissophora ornata]|nr:WD40-repeat-containing domain protein [Dissophora ornata]
MTSSFPSLPLPARTIRSDIAESSILRLPNTNPSPSGLRSPYPPDVRTFSTRTFNSAGLTFIPGPVNMSKHSAAQPSHRSSPTYPSLVERARLEDQLYSMLLDGPRIDILLKLPYEVATYILCFMDMATLAKAAIISKAWKQLSEDSEIWRSIFLYQRRWKINIPASQPVSTYNVTHQYWDVARKEAASTHSLLDWKRLCRDRKALEARWKSMPAKTKLIGHEDSVYCIQFDSTKIVTGSRDHTIKFWDARTLQCTSTLEGHSLSVLCLQFNERMMVSGSSDKTIIVWDMKTQKPHTRLYGHTAGVLDVCFDDQYIISCSKDTSIRVWDVRTMALLKIMVGHRGPVNAVQLHQGQVVSASGDELVKLWDVATGLCIRDFVGHKRGLACVQFDGETIVSGSNDKTIRIWEAATGKCTRVLTGHDDLVRTLHFDQNRIVSGSYDCTVKVWDMKTGECTLNLSSGHVSWVFDVQFSCSRIISTSQDKNIVVWDFAGDIDTTFFG